MSNTAEPVGGCPPPVATVALAHVENEIAHHISSLNSKRTFYRRRSFVQTVSASVLGALTTFLIGLGQIYPRAWLSAASLASAGLTTVTAAWAGWLGARQAWVIHQVSLNKFYALRSRIELDKLSRAHTEITLETVNG
ncbi:hypothetical protein [Streptomyces sp. NPDC005408]|uniref:hypothetical protein n=1 Tax=Streptomyces sp. NPDC005408 TaxID=3155341 RepID=UPI0033B343FF